MKQFLMAVFYYLNMVWVRSLLFLVCGRDIKGRENVPRKGGFILAANHLNNADPPILTGITPRRIAWLTKAEWFNTPVVGLMLRMGGMIPVRRFEADLQALRKSQEALKAGRVLGMFPEGTRSRTGGLAKAEPGTALIALRTGALIVPVAIWGTENVKLPRDIFRRTHACVRFGKPFTLPAAKRITKTEVEASTETIMKEIAKLLPPQYRGVYATAVQGPVATTAEGKA
ncbi:MAG: lysophospholipid acyltransferase family protein [Dehalococcoidia bacterium]|nr:lysophospholipid acyltransferase family protein [Dehalococcoidia bacterium]